MAGRYTMALEEGPRIDFEALRIARRERVLEAMARDDLDVLMVMRPGNARYVAGHRPLWRAVVTPWGAMCTLVRRTRAVYLMSTWDDAIPADVPHENLFGLAWNPAKIAANFARIEGLAEARRIAVDGMSAGMAALLGHLAPRAELVDGERLLRELRRVKLPDEVECIRTAIAILEGALYPLRAVLRPGIEEIALKARFHEELGRFGINHPASEGTFCGTPREPGRDGPAPLRQIPAARVIGAGELVAVSAAVHYAGYEGVVGRTWPCLGPSGSPSAAQRTLQRRWQDAFHAVAESCRPGRTPADLRRAWEKSGEAPPPIPIVHGLGLGIEPPMVSASGASDGPGEPLEAGMVLVVQGYVWERGVGGYLGAETVRVTDEHPERLTRLSHDPLAGG